MKKLIIILIVLLTFLVSFHELNAQPNPGSGSGGAPVGKSAPVGSGIIGMICLGFIYGILKKSKFRNMKEK